MKLQSTKNIQSRWIYTFNKHVVSFFTDKNVLDVGCLDGYGTFLYYKNGAKEVTGLDIDEDYVKVSRINYPGLTFKIKDAENIDYKNDFNNIEVVSCLGLLYLLKDQKTFLTKLAVNNNIKTVIIETVNYNENEEIYQLRDLKFLKIDILKNIFLENNWTLSHEQPFWAKELDSNIDKSTPFAQRIVLVFSR
jgi:SAM-dependent methyltransferase